MSKYLVFLTLNQQTLEVVIDLDSLATIENTISQTLKYFLTQ